MAIGYTNASWTLKCDLICEYVCRLLNHMDGTATRTACPRRDPSVAPTPFIDLSRGLHPARARKFPKQGPRAPWRLHQNYPLDIASLRRGKLSDDGTLRFERGGQVASVAAAPEPAAAANAAAA